MKVEAWLFGITTVFLVLVTPAYWLITDASDHGGDWTGTSALVMTTLLVGMVTLYLGLHAKRMDERPEDRLDGEIADGAGELGFFPPYSWWPFWCACTLGIIVLALAVTAWWMLVLGAALGVLALSGWIFEYYRGEHAH
ncbi:cytochrome c oxidase subunit 4 [Nocardioides humilatus]|uniref:Cytochrome c oxidase polypeptide 4 n=1 Tax=Nocardioides humilatus TaxID=2607660 RepID=A0A5B1LB76_9ACTN|nr:cytochrome c oxidase subunit 4 [Nocardioides humilatus]KAA1417991.1 cytochrome c oxidase subunit 4 [Nocardioides humilatus]